MGNDLSRPPVLVTGAAGYLGGRVLAALHQRGIAAIGTSRNAGDAWACDLLDRAAVEHLVKQTGAATIVHCAARVPKDESGYTNDLAAHDSVQMVTNLAAARLDHIVFTSSMTVYRADMKMPTREEDAAADLTGYARGKRAAEEALLNAPEVNATILRFPGLFGAPRTGGFVFNTAKAFAENRIPQVARRPALWAAMHVDDAAELCVRAAGRKANRSIVLNAGYPVSMSICTVLRDLARIFGRPAPECDAPEFEMDLSRLRRELGLPSNDLTARLREIADWTRLHRHSETDRCPTP